MGRDIANLKDGADRNFVCEFTSQRHEIPPTEPVTIAFDYGNDAWHRISNAVNMV
jgi:hypothetical protein